MANALPRPGVEIEQKFATVSPTILVPSLNACIVGPATYIVDAFNADGTLDTDARISEKYTNAVDLTVLQSSFPDPRNIIANVSIDNASIRAFIAQGSTVSEALRTEALLAPTSATATGDLVDDGLGGTDTTLFEFDFASAPGIAALTDVKAGDRITIYGPDQTFVRTVDAVAAGPSKELGITLDSGIPRTQISTAINFHIIATSDLDSSAGRTVDVSAAAFLRIGLAGEVILESGFLRSSADGSAAASVTADVYIQYEALRRDISANPLTGNPALLTFQDQDDLDAQIGPVSLRNPLSVGVLFALINSPTRTVNAIGLDETSTAAPEGTLVSYNRALSFLESKEVYGLAPLTQDPVVHQAFSTHVTAQSAPTAKKERIVLVNQAQPANEPDKTRTSGALASTITRAAILSEGFSLNEDFNADVESDIGAALTAAGVVGATDLIKAGKLRDAGIYFQVAGGQQVFPIRTIVDGKLEIINKFIASDATTDSGVNFGAGAAVTGAGIVTLTFSQLGTLTLEDAGVRVGDKIDIIVQSGGTTDITPDPLIVKTIVGNVVTADITAGDRTSVDEYQIELVSTDYTLDVTGFEGSDPGSPFVNQTWAVRTLGSPLVISGTVPPIVDRPAVAAGLSTLAESFANRRVVFVQPDTVVTTAISGVEDVIPGYYLTSAIAGMVGQQPPQQGFTNFPIAGFTRLINANDVYSDTDLDNSAGGGVYWVIQEAVGAAVASRHQLTTDVTSVETRELSITKVVDFASKTYRASLRRFIGRFNINPEFLDQLSTVIQGVNASLISRGILNGAELKRIAVDENQPDAIIIEIVLDVPFPSNFIRITLIV